MSDLIEPSPVSVSVKIAPRDFRCRYWAKVIRANQPLPLPSAVDGANDIPSLYARRGEEELMSGDVLIEGEEVSHRKARGWSYWVTFVHNGEACTTTPGGTKAAMKAAGMPAELLTGSGDVAACVRVVHGLRLGMADVIAGL